MLGMLSQDTRDHLCLGEGARAVLDSDISDEVGEDGVELHQRNFAHIRSECADIAFTPEAEEEGHGVLVEVWSAGE